MYAVKAEAYPNVSFKTSNKKQDILKWEGTVSVTVLANDSRCKDLVALSFYDSKSVYFVTKVCEKILWVKKNVSCGTKKFKN